MNGYCLEYLIECHEDGVRPCISLMLTASISAIIFEKLGLIKKGVSEAVTSYYKPAHLPRLLICNRGILLLLA